MASDYGLNFGFRRSDESVATREGRFKTPDSGSPLRLGIAVQIDAAEPGYLKMCAANAAPLTGSHGILVQEESHLGDIFSVSPLNYDSYDLGLAKLDTLSVIWGGPSKIWLRNTPAYARGSRSKDAVQMVSLTSLAVGDQLGWDGSKWVKSDGSTTPHWMTVTAKAGSTSTDGYVEAVLNF